jgi:hypothetical protein
MKKRQAGPGRWSRPSYANVVSSLALFVALGGTSYAAVTVTGREVRDGSLTGRDIRNGSITSADVQNGSLRSGDLRSPTGNGQIGPRGESGERGPAGATGPQGERGPSAAFSFASAADRRNVGPELTELGHLNLPAGNYVLAAKVHTDNESSTTPMDVSCFLTGPGGLLDQGEATMTGNGGPNVQDEDVITLIASAKLPSGGRLAFACSNTGGVGTIVEMKRVRMTATQVAVLEQTSG